MINPIHSLSAPNDQRISAGYYHGLFVDNTGTLWSWGDNDYGQLGDGTTIGRENPRDILEDVVALSAGGLHNLVLKDDGTLWAWGSDHYGQLGIQTEAERVATDMVPDLALMSNSPKQILDDVIAVSSGGWHSMALRRDGTVWSWGRNDYGQLGIGSDNHQSEPMQIDGLSDIVAITAGGWHSMALTSDGRVYVWGGNQHGQLGNGTTINVLTPELHGLLQEMISVSAGFYHNIALDSNGHVWVWGQNGNGQLGDGTRQNSSTPKKLEGFGDVIAVSAGYYHSLALKSDHSVYAWGENSKGQLGDGTTQDRTTPTRVPHIHNIAQIAAGSKMSMALDKDDIGWSWGWNQYGQLGDGTMMDRLEPVQIRTLPTRSQDSAQIVHVQLRVNDTEHQGIARGTYKVVNGKPILEITVIEDLLSALLDEFDAPTVVLRLDEASDKVVFKFDGDIMQQMANTHTTLTLYTPLVNVTLPVSEIGVSGILDRFTAPTRVDDIAVMISLSESTARAVELARRAVGEGLTLASSPVDVAIEFNDGRTTVQKDRFDRYLTRELPIRPLENDGKRRVAVLQADGSIRYVPARFIVRDGKEYAVMSSLSSDPFLIVEETTYTEYLSYMLSFVPIEVSRLYNHIVPSEYDSYFYPDNYITRSELATIFARALRDRMGMESTRIFHNIEGVLSYADKDAVVGWGGRDSNPMNQPDPPINYLDAMVIISRAMEMIDKVDINEKLPAVDRILAKHTARLRGIESSNLHQSSLESSVQHDSIRYERRGSQLFMTRVDKATVIWRILKIAGLIDTNIATI